MNTSLRVIVAAVLLLTVATAQFLLAGNTGKIIGKATDSKTGEPLPNVNILVVGTQRGNNTDLDGKYVLIGVPIGRYSVRASCVGYQEVEVKDVKVGADETTSLDFEMTPTEVALPTVVITADQKLVNPLTTSSTKTISEKAISEIPNVKEVTDVVKLQAGVVKQGSNLFLRGGRANEVQYLVDGIPTNSLMGSSGELTSAAGGVNDQLQKLYAGVQSGAIGGGANGLEISAGAIQSVSVQTSGFDADYGNAQSGVVNIVTKSGGESYTSGIQYRTDKLSSTNQNEDFSSFNLGGPEPITKYLMPSLGVKIPGQLSFFLNADMNRADGAYQYIHNDFYNPVERKVQLSGFLGGLLNGLGFTYRDNESNKFTFDSKLRYDLSGSDQFFYSYKSSLSSGDGYNHGYKYLADSSQLSASLNTQHVGSWTHFFGTNSFLRLNVGEVEQHSGSDVAGLYPWQYTSANPSSANGDGFYHFGSDQYWSSTLTRDWTVRLDMNSQVHPLHLLKAGFEFHYEELASTGISDPTQPHLEGGAYVYPPFSDTTEFGQDRDKGLYPGYGLYRSVLNNFDNHGAFYLQDNIEFSGLNLHVGVRYDYFDVGRQVYDAEFLQDWERDVNGNLPENLRVEPDWVNNIGYDTTDVNGVKQPVPKGLSDKTRFLYFLTHGYVSPRLSIGYPVTDRIVFYFNYGHFLQFPDRDNYFTDPFVFSTPGIVGNPGLKPQRTISYESGFEDQFSDDMAFGVHAFYKDVFDYPATLPRAGYMSPWINLDYGSDRGFELTVTQALSGNLSTNVSYTYQVAKGRASSPLASVFDPNLVFLPREARLSYDQEHTANVFVAYRVGPKEDGKFFGLPFVNNYSISLTWSIGSGLPYTPYVASYNQRNVYLVNTETSPYSSTVNLTINKGFYILEKVNLQLSLDMLNLLDRKNVNPGAGGFNTLTGAPLVYGDYNASTHYINPYNTFDASLPPYIFEAPRQILFGVKLNWE